MKHKDHTKEDVELFKPLSIRLIEEYGYASGAIGNYRNGSVPWEIILQLRDAVQRERGYGQSYDHSAMAEAMRRYDDIQKLMPEPLMDLDEIHAAQELFEAAKG